MKKTLIIKYNNFLKYGNNCNFLQTNVLVWNQTVSKKPRFLLAIKQSILF